MQTSRVIWFRIKFRAKTSLIGMHECTSKSILLFKVCVTFYIYCKACRRACQNQCCLPSLLSLSKYVESMHECMSKSMQFVKFSVNFQIYCNACEHWDQYGLSSFVSLSKHIQLGMHVCTTKSIFFAKFSHHFPHLLYIMHTCTSQSIPLVKFSVNCRIYCNASKSADEYDLSNFLLLSEFIVKHARVHAKINMAC